MHSLTIGYVYHFVSPCIISKKNLTLIHFFMKQLILTKIHLDSETVYMFKSQSSSDQSFLKSLNCLGHEKRSNTTVYHKHRTADLQIGHIENRGKAGGGGGGA